MRRLRPLSEAECYTRLYGAAEPTVTVVRRQAAERPARVSSGESLRRLFEERLDAREADSVEVEAA